MTTVDIGSFAWDGRSQTNSRNASMCFDCNVLPPGPPDAFGNDSLAVAHLMASSVHFRKFVEECIDKILEEEPTSVLFGSENGHYRAVAVAEVVAKHLAGTGHYDVILTHYNIAGPSKRISKSAHLIPRREGDIYYA